jgi:signal transduction histidine kinase
MVPQLWLWVTDNIVISAHNFTQHLRYFEKDFLPTARNPIWKPRRDHLADDPLLASGCLIATCIERFGKEEIVVYKGTTYTYPPTLDIFENRVVSILSETRTYLENPKRTSIDFDKEKDFHHALSDIRIELAMIKHFLAQQQKMLNRLLDEPTAHKEVSEDTGDNNMNWNFVNNATIMLQGYQDRVQKIDGDAERIGASVQDMLNLKRTYASVQDSHASVLLSTAAIGFAIVTIIFAPLAFLTALFALDIQGFDKLRVGTTGGNDQPDLSTTTTDGGAAQDSGLTVNVNIPKNDDVYDSSKLFGVFCKYTVASELCN